MSNVKLGELRVNNWYQSTKFKVPVKCEISDIVQIYHNADGAAVDEDHIAMVFKPIPLTEDWLKKLGGRKHTDFFIYGRFILRWQSTYGYWYVNSFPEKTYLTKIEWVHEWQNFVFAMNSEELKIKDL